MKIVAVTGTNGSGKGTFVRFLEEEGYMHYSARMLIFEEIEKRGLEPNRESTRLVGNSLRQIYSSDYVARELLRRAEEYAGQIGESISEQKIIIESIRCVSEVHFLKKHNVILIAVDDPVEVRYQRISKRKHSTDFVSLAEFIEQERMESVGSEEWDMNIPACVAEADFVFSDNGDIEEFREKVHAWLGKQNK